MRPRPQALQTALLAGLQAALGTGQLLRQAPEWLAGGDGSWLSRMLPLLLLLGVVLLWGTCIGGLLHAFWPAAPGAAGTGDPGTRPPLARRQTALLYGVPTALLGLLAAGLVVNGQPGERQAVQRAHNRLVREADRQDLQVGSCRPPLVGADEERASCFFLRADGETAAELLLAVLQETHTRVKGQDTLPLTRTGNTVGGKVRLSAGGGLLRRTPLTLEYRGLVYVNRRGPLSPEERWLSEQPFKAYAVLRPGHE